jgi:ubiquinone/menaquinone biosynthesis C-methylase UbiE
MLKIAREKVLKKKLSDKVTLTHADMAKYSLPEKNFSMAFITFRSFMHLYTQEDQLSCLECTFNHLKPGGLLIIDVYSPRFSKMAAPPDEEFNVHKEYTLRARRWRGTDLVTQLNTEDLLFEEYDLDDVLIRSMVVPITTRYTFRYEMQLLIERAGFCVISVYKDFNGNLYDGVGEIITVAEKPS